MEPADLNQSSPEDAQVEQWLRNQTCAHPLPDDGFSRRVLIALPPPERAAPSRTLVMLAGGLMGVYVAWRQGFSVEQVSTTLQDLGATCVQTSEQLMQPSVLLALAVTGLSLVFAYWRELVQRFDL